MALYERQNYLFSLMHHVLWSFLVPLAYGGVASTIIWFTESAKVFSRFVEAYFVSFNCVISAGLILGAVSFVYFTQGHVVELIEKSFFDKDLRRDSGYQESKRRFLSVQRSISFSAQFILVAFLIFYTCQFPFEGFAQYAMIGIGCAQYGMGVYVGRKLFYFSKMLNDVEKLHTKEDVFTDGNLGLISSYVNILSTLTVVFVYVHVKSFYGAPFEFNTILGASAKHFLLLPGIIAIPVLIIFNFYPRSVLRTLYSRSINVRLEELTKSLEGRELSQFEQLSYVAEREKMSRDELKYRLQLSLSDIPIGITIVALIISLIKDGLG
ncbi:hypothetical protein ACR42D_14875 [Desulfovibrio caledoniensis]